MYLPKQFLICCALATLAASSAMAHDPAVIEPPEEKKWDSSIALGLNVTSGNSDTVLFNLQYRAKREWEHDIWSLGADASYGEDSGDKNNEAAGAFAEYQRLLTERLYAALRLNVTHDAIANTEYRVAIGPALGYYFIKSEVTRLNFEAGPTWVIEKRDVNHPNLKPIPPAKNEFYVTSDVRNYWTARLAERFEHDFSKRSKIWQSIEFLPQVDDLNNYLVNAELGTEAALNSHLSVRVVLQDKYDNVVAEGTEKNDLSLISSLVYNF